MPTSPGLSGSASSCRSSVPVAVNCSVSPLATLGLAGVTAIDCKTAALTVSTVEPTTPLSVALIVEVPSDTPVARPCDPDGP